MLFQLAIAQTINTAFYRSPESSEKCTQNLLEFYKDFNKLIQKINKIREENSQNDSINQDIVLDYGECLSFLPKINKNRLISEISCLIEQIKNSKHISFSSSNFDFSDFEIWLQDLDGESLIDWMI